MPNLFQHSLYQLVIPINDILERFNISFRSQQIIKKQLIFIKLQRTQYLMPPFLLIQNFRKPSLLKHLHLNLRHSMFSLSRLSAFSQMETPIQSSQTPFFKRFLKVVKSRFKTNNSMRSSNKRNINRDFIVIRVYRG